MSKWKKSFSQYHRGNACKVCGVFFTAKTWEDRHTDPEDNISDIHAECCGFCAPIW